jgi:hypothetical protein
MLEALVKVVYGITALLFMLFKCKAVLKLIVDFSPLLTGVEGVRSSGNAFAFSSCRCFFEDAHSMSCGRSESKGDTGV